MKQPPPPFSCTHSPQFPELLLQMESTLVISTYQAGKVIFMSSIDEDQLVQLPRDFARPMGMAVCDRKLAVAVRNSVVILARSSEMGPSYPPQPGVYDSVYIPTANYFTGAVDMHDMSWGNEGLWGVNTLFSCLSLIDDDYSFQPAWMPPFITELAGEDRCHLNGLAMEDGVPRYVTALGATDSSKEWRNDKVGGGIVIDVQTDEIVLRGLAMPHSPRLYQGKLFLLLSATGELVCADLETGKYDVVAKMNGFVRGMCLYGDYLFVGMSRLRKTSTAFSNLPISKGSVQSGITIVHLPSGSVMGQLVYKSSCEEIYDVQILAGVKRPGILGLNPRRGPRGILVPDGGFWNRNRRREESTQGPGRGESGQRLEKESFENGAGQENGARKEEG